MLTSVPVPTNESLWTSSNPAFAVEVYAPVARRETRPFVATIPAVLDVARINEPVVMPVVPTTHKLIPSTIAAEVTFTTTVSSVAAVLNSLRMPEVEVAPV